MRLQIERPSFSLRIPFRFVTADATIDVMRETQKELRWTWCNDTDVRLHVPRRRFGKPQMWRVEADDLAYIGQWDGRPSRHFRLNAREWLSADEVFYQDSQFCSGAVRSADKRRIVFWQKKCSPGKLWGEVICKDSIATNQLSILLGMVLADFWPHD